MPFDPDNYIADKTSGPSKFDPDAYLAEKAPAPEKGMLEQAGDFAGGVGRAAVDLATGDPLGAHRYLQGEKHDGVVDSFRRGLLQGGTAGFADEAAGTMGAAKALGAGTDVAGGYREARDAARAGDAASAAANPIATVGGNVVGAAAVPAGGASTAARVAQAIARGGASGLGTSTADLTKGDVAGAARDTAVGAGVGGIAQGAGELAAAGAARAATAAQPLLNRAADAGGKLRDHAVEQAVKLKTPSVGLNDVIAEGPYAAGRKALSARGAWKGLEAADRFGLMLQKLRGTPEASRFAAPLEEAIRQGGNAPAVTHYIMSQRYPAYRKATEDEGTR